MGNSTSFFSFYVFFWGGGQTGKHKLTGRPGCPKGVSQSLNLCTACLLYEYVFKIRIYFIIGFWFSFSIKDTIYAELQGGARLRIQPSNTKSWKSAVWEESLYTCFAQDVIVHHPSFSICHFGRVGFYLRTISQWSVQFGFFMRLSFFFLFKLKFLSLFANLFVIYFFWIQRLADACHTMWT